MGTGALAQTRGNVTAAARLLGISRATLHRKIRRLSLPPSGTLADQPALRQRRLAKLATRTRKISTPVPTCCQ
ncbi:helix-turn-helix domain-containing protein [Geminicoccus flavidas]|uniref:helix-turn-helix domain-containing protein n=1 Tax=Geminicoccus flavidas TaxID=2506407 RepID=UPI0038B36F0D